MKSSSLSQSKDNRQSPSLYIPSLDGIRAVSFLIVFLAHAGLEKWVPGYFGLTLFFFLSGFLITTLLRMEQAKTGQINLKAFYLRRVLRIFPPFYCVLALASILTVVRVVPGPELTLEASLFQMFHLSNYYVVLRGWWDGRAPGTWVYWSLAVEEHFYLVFPMAYLLMCRWGLALRRQVLVLAGLCVFVLLWRCVLVFGFNVPKDRVYVATDTRVDSIILGCILALYGNPILDRTRFSERWWKFIWLPAALGLILLTFTLRTPWFDQTFRYSLQGIGLFPFFIVAVRYHDWVFCRLLNLRAVKLLGLLSYSMYLMHTTVIYALQEWTPWHPLLQGAMSLVLTIVLASVIYEAIEKPCAALRKRLSHTESPPHLALTSLEHPLRERHQPVMAEPQ